MKNTKNERITNFGEVFTNKNEVTSMLDMVKHETVRIDGRFLENLHVEMEIFLLETA